jgi:hypothetical protein
VRDAVGTTQKVIAGVRDPLKGAGELAATVAEKVVGISPENKRTYTVQNANSDWFRFDPETGETLKLARKR